MAWEHADFEEQPTASAKLAKLNQHITEVRNRIQEDASSGSTSKSYGTLTQYLADLNARRMELERQARSASGSRYLRPARPFRGGHGGAGAPYC